MFSEGSGDSEESGEKGFSTVPLTNAQKSTLYPTPSPISFPRRTSYPDSVPSLHGYSIPSIPPFPSPALGSGMGQGALCNCQLSQEQFNQLLSATPSQPVKPDSCVMGCALLQSFLGSLTLFFHALHQASKQQMTFVQCDRGVYTYRNEGNNVVAVMAIEGAVNRITLRAARGEGTW